MEDFFRGRLMVRALVDLGLAAPVRAGVEVRPHRGKPKARAANTAPVEHVDFTVVPIHNRLDEGVPSPSDCPPPCRALYNAFIERVFEHVQTYTVALTVRQELGVSEVPGRISTVGGRGPMARTLPS
jgi:hypothetical protein